MNDTMLATEALECVLSKYSFQTVLDVGSGQGLHADAFRRARKTVVTLDASVHWGRADIAAEFTSYPFNEPFDLVWCSHVLEHQQNVQAFIVAAYRALKPGGILAITVPPSKPNIVGGHVSVWNTGLLLYNLILSGFNCREAMAKKYGYNISIVVRKSFATLPPLRMDAGDIELIAHLFPACVQARQDFDGEIDVVDWSLESDPRPVSGPVLDARTMDIDRFRSVPCPFADDLDSLVWAVDCAELPGAILEFGVFRGRSLAAIAARQPLRPIFGFDSFIGLPEPWVRSDTSTYARGHFALESLPQINYPNVQLVPGFFDQSLPIWMMRSRDMPIAAIHIDADLYSSAAFILRSLNSRISPGVVLIFDELADWRDSGVYPRWMDGEWRALTEWVNEFGREIRILSRGPDFSATVVVTK